MCGFAVLKTICLHLDILEEYRLAQDQQRPRFSCGCLPLASPSHCKTTEGLLPVPVALVLLGGAAAGRMRPLWAGARCAQQHLSPPGLVPLVCSLQRERSCCVHLCVDHSHKLHHSVL